MKNLRSFQPAVFFFETFSNLVPPENCARKRTWLTNPAENCKATNSHEMSRAGNFPTSSGQVALNCVSFDLQILKLIVCCLQLPGEKIWARKLRTAEAKSIKHATFSLHVDLKALEFTNFAGGITTARFSSVFIFFIMFGTISKVSQDLIYATYIRCCAKLMFCRSTQVSTLYSKDRHVHGCTLYWPRSIPKTTSAQHPWKTRVEPISSLCFVLFQEVNDKSHDFSIGFPIGGEDLMDDLNQFELQVEWIE